MELLKRIVKVVSSWVGYKQSPEITGYQLWLNDLGSKPAAVINYLVEDMFIAGAMEHPDDIPELPWEIIELPAGSDTYSFIHIKANELKQLGALVSVVEV